MAGSTGRRVCRKVCPGAVARASLSLSWPSRCCARALQPPLTQKKKKKREAVLCAKVAAPKVFRTKLLLRLLANNCVPLSSTTLTRTSGFFFFLCDAKPLPASRAYGGDFSKSCQPTARWSSQFVNNSCAGSCARAQTRKRPKTDFESVFAYVLV